MFVDILFGLLFVCKSRGSIIIFAFFEALKSLSAGGSIIFFFNLFYFFVWFGGVKLCIAIKIVEVMIFASGIGFLVGNIREAVVLHNRKLTNKYNKIIII